MSTRKTNIKQRQPNPAYASPRSYKQLPTKEVKGSNFFIKGIVLIIVLLIGLTVFSVVSGSKNILNPSSTSQNTKSASQSASNSSKSTTSSSTQAPAPNACASNTLSQLILVSISQRHLWACDNSTQVYSSAVITGDVNYVADATPLGSYHIYAKETNLYLNGSDALGSWHDWVYYWMPFLNNQYGVFGLHDATWRTSTDFGNISPDSAQASHGCVELPLATATWLFNWSVVGTTVTISS